MHLMKQAGKPEPGRWRFVKTDQIREWREDAVRNVMNDEGRQVVAGPVATAVHRGWDQAEVDAAGNAVMERPAPEKPHEGRVVVEWLQRELADQMLHWSKHNPELYRQKIQVMKQTSGMSHLTDEQAAQQVYDLCRKVAESDAARVFGEDEISRRHWYQGAVLL